MKVTPIIAPALDWGAFVSEAHASTKRSPTASLNMAGLKPGLLKTVVPALGEFCHEHTAAIPFLRSRDCDHVLSMLFVSFMVEAEPAVIGRLCCLARLRSLAPDDCTTVVILTGSLREWRDAIISGSRLSLDPGVREVVNEIQRYLTNAGLGDLFAACVARRHSDGTTILEIKSGK